MFVWRLSVISGVFRLSCSLFLSVVCTPVLPRPRRLKGLFRSPFSCNRPNYSQRTKTHFGCAMILTLEVITSPTCYICYMYSYHCKNTLLSCFMETLYQEAVLLTANLPHAKREKSDAEIRMTNTVVQVKQNRHYSSRVTSMTKET